MKNETTYSDATQKASTTQPAPQPAAVTPHANALQHAGAVLIHELPYLGEVAGALVQAGIHLSPQAQMAASILMLLAAMTGQGNAAVAAPQPVGFTPSGN